MAHADLAVRRSSTAVRHTENAKIYFYICDLVFARFSVQAVPKRSRLQGVSWPPTIRSSEETNPYEKVGLVT